MKALKEMEKRHQKILQLRKDLDNLYKEANEPQRRLIQAALLSALMDFLTIEEKE